MNAAISVLTFLVRHFLSVLLAIGAGCVLWTIAYLLLLAVAVAGNDGPGGPLAWPAGIATIVVGGAVIGWGIFAPASGLGSLACSWLRWPRLAAIPVVFGGAFVFSYLLYRAFIELLTTHSVPPIGTIAANYLLFLSLPLGVYWWLTEGPGALFEAARRWGRRREVKTPEQPPQPAAPE